MIEKEFNYLVTNYQTPFYFFDMVSLKDRIEYLRHRLPNKVKLCYAIKANSFILKDIEDLIDRYEVCSFGEYHICDSSKINKEKIVLSGVYKEEKDLKYLFQNNVSIGIYTIESWEQYNLLKNLTNEFKKNIKVLLRLTSGNQFGMDKSIIHNIFKDLKNSPYIKIIGLQFFFYYPKTFYQKIK